MSNSALRGSMEVNEECSKSSGRETARNEAAWENT
jgi:hypothetical protein